MIYCHIYIPVWLVFIFEYVMYFILWVFLSQIYDLVYAIHLYLKLFSQRKLCTDPQLFCRCNWFFVIITMAVKLPHPTLSFVIFLCVCFSTHSDEDINEIIDSSHAGFSALVENIFKNEFLIINTWFWVFWYKASCSLLQTKMTRRSDNGNMFVCWCLLLLMFPLYWTANLSMIQKKLSMIGTWILASWSKS